MGQYTVVSDEEDVFDGFLAGSFVGEELLETDHIVEQDIIRRLVSQSECLTFRLRLQSRLETCCVSL